MSVLRAVGKQIYVNISARLLKVGTIERGGDRAIERVKKRLLPCGYRQWLDEQ